MAGRFVRSSKYRHVFSEGSKRNQCYDNLRISTNAFDSNLIKVNPEYLSVNWQASGGGSFAVIPLNECGKLSEQIPLFQGHTAAVLDTDWNPFDDRFIASASDNGQVFLWKVPENFSVLPNDATEIVDVSPISQIAAHAKKVGQVLFNPAASNVLASSSVDRKVKIWDVDQGKDQIALEHPDNIVSMSWNANGSYLITSCRDKKLRFWDVRQKKAAQTVPGHAGAKNCRAVWLGDSDRVATTGFSPRSDRELALWDVKNPTKPLNGFQNLDTSSGICMPFWDDCSKIIFLAGKGDGNIRYFELENDRFEALSQYQSATPQRGIAFLPRRGLDLHANEIARAYKTVNDQYIEPLPFIVTRVADSFQDDIYPPAYGLKPGLSGDQWFAGAEPVLPPLLSFEAIYNKEKPTYLSAEEAAKVKKDAGSSKAEAETPKATPKAEAKETKAAPTATATTPAAAATASVDNSDLKTAKTSMAAFAAKFADPEDADTVGADDDSSFEEIQKPIDRYVSVSTSKTALKASRPASAPTSAARSIPQTMSTSSPTASKDTTSTTATAAPSATLSATFKPYTSGASQSMHDESADLKTQVRTLTDMVKAQTDTIKNLEKRLDTLAGEQAGKIRNIELQLEEIQD